MNISQNIFHHNNLFTIGVEEEYMLCHPVTGDIINKADEIITDLNKELKERYSYELLLSEIEVNTSVCHSVNDVIKDGYNGFLFDAYDAKSLKVAILRAIDLTPKDIHRMCSINCELVKEKYSIRKIVKYWEQIYSA